VKRLIPLFCFFCVISHAYPWSAQGHRALSEVARQLLTPEAKKSVEQILGNDDLAAVSTWLDDVRNLAHHHSGPLKGDAEAIEFNSRFPANDKWHYVDLPVGSPNYVLNGPFSSVDDVVHAINRAIDVLEGRSEEFTKIQALRVLVHLVGDIHQPLHTVSGYFDLHDPTQSRLVSNPQEAKNLPHDRGGNQLFYTKTLELHALWDTHLVNKLVHAKTPEPLAALLAKGASLSILKTPGDYHEWANRWASDSASEAIGAYEHLIFGPGSVKADGQIDRIEIIPPDDYDEQQLLRVERQLQKAAVHLAQLLNSIGFK
jgi:hypothetical protein